MKSWFPLADYDFYAFLTAGMILIAAGDFSFGGSQLIGRSSWSIFGAVFWIVIAYLIGQVTAGWSASILEFGLARCFFRAPVDLILGISRPRLRERAVEIFAGAREYKPFPPAVSAAVLQKASERLGGFEIIDGETAFQIAFPVARRSSDTAARLDRFINVYGMCRNTSFVAFIAAVFLIIAAFREGSIAKAWLSVATLILAVGMFGRFMKFYAAYSREVFRTFNSMEAL
jgi:hypothetical protein